MRRLHAFTLIELLVVIAVIAVLLAIIMPALGKAKNLAQGIACKGNMKNYTIAVAMYCDDNDGKFCEPATCYFSQSTAFPVESGLSSYIHVRWCNGNIDLKSHPQYGGHLFKYLANAKAFICPTYKTIAVRQSEDHFYQADAANLKNYEPWYNYTMNAYLGPRRVGGADHALKEIRVDRIGQVKNPATTFSFCEESAYVDTRYNISGLNDTYMIPGDVSMVKSWLAAAGGNPWNVEPGPGTSPTFYDVLAGYHNAPTGDLLKGRGNCAFVDGHVDAHAREETFPLAYPLK
ncbi:MAG TPA: type II secretion system protein [Sedimentisphaerales bacterium]|nr:type II secretion system protein [Sedimentisphaerales bacterium]HQI28412.1 type II secretion system protein [Sedimentisphaerales bacterium]